MTHVQRATGWFHCLEENTDIKGGMLLKLLYKIHTQAKIVYLFRLALFGFSHALVVFLTLLLTAMHVACDKVFVTILCCMLQNLVSLYQVRQVLIT